MVLEDKINSVDVKVSVLSGISPEIHKVQRLYNPLKVYHELVNAGMDKISAQCICKIYEIQFYSFVTSYYKKKVEYEKEKAWDSPSYDKRTGKSSYP